MQILIGNFDPIPFQQWQPDQDKQAKSVLDQMVGDWMHYSLLNNTCQEFSCEMFDFFKEQFRDAEWFFDPPSPPPFDGRGWRGGDL